MGLLHSKFFENDSVTSVSMAAEVLADPRSPSVAVTRTPIVVEKKPYLETNLDEVLKNDDVEFCRKMFRARLLKSLHEDPRSPTIGIERTPILVDGTVVVSRGKFDSPMSVYSSNYRPGDSAIDITALSDPSVNVSDFDETCNSFSDEIDNLVDDIMKDVKDLTMEDVHELSAKEDEETVEAPLAVSDKPNTTEAKRLFEELCAVTPPSDYSKESPELFQGLLRDVTPIRKSKSKMSKRLDKVKVCEPIKVRTPLSNITSSANSPSQITKLKPSAKKVKAKIVLDVGAENTCLLSNKTNRHKAQWDTDTTVFI